MGEINQSIISDRSGRVSSELSAGFFLVSGFFLVVLLPPFLPPLLLLHLPSCVSVLKGFFWNVFQDFFGVSLGLSETFF